MKDKYTVKMVKPSGVELDVNVRSLEAAYALGWKKVNPTVHEKREEKKAEAAKPKKKVQKKKN